MNQKDKQGLLTAGDFSNFRRRLSHELGECGNTIEAAYNLGLQSLTPGMSFLGGYQCAIRCLLPEAGSDSLGAFCVSEKGVSKPADMSSVLLPSGNGSYILNGRKDFVMMYREGLDELVIVAKNDQGWLQAVRVNADADGISLREKVVTPFVTDIPHYSLSFRNVIISDDQLVCEDAQSQASKPFRYWEDLHVCSAMLGWMQSHGTVDETLIQKRIDDMKSVFRGSPSAYTSDSLDLIDNTESMLEEFAETLTDDIARQWNKDRTLLMMGKKIRSRIRSALSAEAESTER